MTSQLPRLIAFYLPQFHPIPENDEWWGKGFTEWTNVVKARPLFKGHYQPHLPADLGFYDLRVPEVREAQAQLARQAGIEGFCYYHYWFGNGRRLLERPLNEVVASGRPDYPFCLCWANESWSGIWHGAADRILMEQTYPGLEDHERHFQALLPAFKDRRYMRVHGCPIFVVYRPLAIPDVATFTGRWQQLARENGLDGMHFIAHLIYDELNYDYRRDGFERAVVIDYTRFQEFLCWKKAWAWARGVAGAACKGRPPSRRLMDLARLWMRHLCRSPLRWKGTAVSNYADTLLYALDAEMLGPDRYACVVPNWDNSPRSGNSARVFRDSTPELFQGHLRRALQLVADREPEERLLFIKSWNEWGEGNYLEPDARYGHGYLEACRREILG
jgi:lipopolysaccharide biosynthesis protein